MSRRLLGSTQRRWRTRPSEVRASIMIGDIDFFEAHKNSTFRDITIGTNDDPSYELHREKPKHKSIVVMKTKKAGAKGVPKKKKKKKKENLESSIDMLEIKKLNAIFEDVNDFSLIIEKVVEDDYVMNSKSHDSNASSSSGPYAGIVCGNDDSSVWCYDDQSNLPKFLTSTPKFGSYGQRLDFKSPANLPIISDKQSFEINSFKEKSNSKFVLETDENFNLQSPANLKKIHYASFINKNLKEVLVTSSQSGSKSEQLLIKTPEITNNDQICLKDVSSNKWRDNLLRKKTLSDDSNEPLESYLTVASNSSLVTTEKIKNMSQLAVENSLKLFYYLRGFFGEATDINYLLHACLQKSIIEWDQLLSPNSLKGCHKLGEGVYGEVFKALINNTPVALKIIPFLDKETTFDSLVNGEKMKRTLEVLPELLITKDLSDLAESQHFLLDQGKYTTPSFVRLVKAAVVRGNYPNKLLTEWDRFAKTTKKSENDRPDTYSSKDQLFIVFALSLGGKDLESYIIKNEKEAFSILFQIALSLAVAEEVLEFEHRDLHIGNVLVANCKSMDVIKYVFNNEVIAIKSHGVNVSIIDFTNSRMQREGTTIFLDLSTDKELFEGVGDYQFDIYRQMRDKNKNQWKSFTPYTNVLWLHYIATKVFASKKILAKRRKEIMAKLDRLLSFERIKFFLKDEAILEILEDYIDTNFFYEHYE